MKKLIIAFALLFCVVLASCGNDTANEMPTLGIVRDGIASVAISSLPEGYNYSFDGKDSIGAIVDYFSSLSLIEDYPENPDEYTGMTWVIEFLYADGRTLTVYHFGNMFVRAENGPWYKMAYGDAIRFDEIIWSMSGGK